MKKRLAGALLGLVVLGGPFSLQSSSQDSQGELAGRINLKPKRPKSGTKTGRVIAYGHLLQAPYLLEYRGEKLFVNDIQVEPSLLIEQFHPKPRPDEGTKDVAKKVVGISKWARADFAKGKTASQILEAVKREEGIAGGKVVSDNEIELIVNFPRGPVHWTIPLSDAAQEGSSSTDHRTPEARANEAKGKHLAWLKGSLQKGNCLIFLSEGGVAVAPAPELVVADVNKVMAAQSTAEEKRARLENEVFSWNKAIARDVLANYSESEWMPQKH